MKKKVVVVGLDGLEPTIVESLLERGELANFAKLRQMGGYGRLRYLLESVKHISVPDAAKA